MRTNPKHNNPNPVQTFSSRISLVRNWKFQKRVKMDGKQIKRCAKELGISSAAVKDCLNATETAKRREGTAK